MYNNYRNISWTEQLKKLNNDIGTQNFKEKYKLMMLTFYGFFKT